MIRLIIFDGNWADEMDFNSHLLVDDTDKDDREDWENLKKVLSYDEETLENTGWVCIGLGSNEYIDFDNCLELFNALEIHNITDEEAKTIRKYFGYSYGAADISHVLERIVEGVEDPEDEEDEDDE